MNNKFRIPLMVCLALAFIIATSAFTTTNPQDDKVVFGGTYVLSDGETLYGNLVILGGTVTLEQNSTVNGDTALIGGTLDANGTINGNLTIVGGVARLGADAVVKKDVFTIGGTLNRAAGSQILGDVNSFGSAPFSLDIPSTPIVPEFPNVPIYPSPVSFLWKVISFFGSVIFSAAVAMLIALLWAKPTQRVANAIVTNPVGTGGFGCLTLIVAPGLLLLVAITIILSPLSLLGLLLLAGAMIFGWTAIDLEVGNRLARLFKVEWSAPIAAGIGALIFNLVVFGFAFIPCLGWMLSFLVLLFALGGVLVTRFGAHEYPEVAAIPVRPVPPAVTPATPAALIAPVVVASKVTEPVAAKTPKAPAAKPKTSAAPKASKPAPTTTAKPAAAPKAKATTTPKPTTTPPAAKPATKSTTGKTAEKTKTK
jgi:hypothetical protein